MKVKKLNKKKCYVCKGKFSGEMEKIEVGVDPIDLGEFGGVIYAHICKSCSEKIYVICNGEGGPNDDKS